jgi:RimJ/RimL family protein N-acetyltransferase
VSRIVRDQRVVDFVAERIGGRPEKCMAVGLERDGLIVAGALYERCNGHNVFFHGAGDGTRRWATREFIRALVRFPFVELNVPRMTAVVAASNLAARAFDEKLGFVEEGRLAGAAHDGSDSIYMTLWRHSCPWLVL